MARLIVLVVFIAVVLAAILVLRACERDQPTTGQATGGADLGIVGLPGGATMPAKRGTVGRDLVDWLASGEQSRSFELGGQEFAGRTPEPTLESRARVTRLVTMLKAYPDVRIHVIGHSSRTSDRVADQALSEARARTLVRLLREGGISKSRVSYEGRGADLPISDNGTAEGRAMNDRVSITLTRTN